MKVAFVCNMNNHFFSMVRHLRDKGIDAHLLILNNEDRQFHPSWDSFDLDYQRYTKFLTWGDHNKLTSVSKRTIRSDLAGFGFIFTCGSVPGYMNYAGLRADVFIPYGSDLAELPFFILQPPRRGALTSPLRFPIHQRNGIREARFLGGAYTPQFEDLFSRINARGKRVAIPVAPLYGGAFNPEKITSFYDRSTWFHHFKRIREASDFVLFHHARHIWTPAYGAMSQKGNDRLIRGFAGFVKSNPKLRASLIMLEYGPDVENSRALIAELGIQENVAWFPLMARKEVLLGASISDIVCGEFAQSWNFGGTIIEGIALAKPLLHYRKDSMYPKEDLFPVLNAYSADEMTAAMERYMANRDECNQMGREAHNWFRTRIIEGSIDRYADLVLNRT